MPTIYLVRHGENPANLSKEFSHRHVDYALNDKGRLQAEQTAAVFVGQSIAAVYSSPLLRAVQTAAIIAGTLGVPTHVIEEFREVNVGSLEGQTPTRELWEQHDNVFRAWLGGQPETTFPNGEDHHRLIARMQAGLRQVLTLTPDQPSIIVGHGGIFTATLAAYCADIDLLAIIRAPNHNCSITEIDLEQRNGQVVGQLRRWADCDHLSGEAARLTNAQFD